MLLQSLLVLLVIVAPLVFYASAQNTINFPATDIVTAASGTVSGVAGVVTSAPPPPLSNSGLPPLPTNPPMSSPSSGFPSALPTPPP